MKKLRKRNNTFYLTIETFADDCCDCTSTRTLMGCQDHCEDGCGEETDEKKSIKNSLEDNGSPIENSSKIGKV